MNHILYKTTNLITGYFYVGMHSTKNVDDSYLGSGTLIKLAIKKYGKENFKREILEVCSSRNELICKEKNLITSDLLADEKCINLMLGGRGGWDHVNDKPRKPHSAKQLSWIRENTSFKRKDVQLKTRQFLIGKSKSDIHKQNISNALKGTEQSKVCCPHCGVHGGERAMKRWHFDNCKMRE